MKDEVGEENVSMTSQRSHAKEFWTYPKDTGRVGPLRLEGATVEEEMIELLHYKEHSDSNVGRQTEGGETGGRGVRRVLQWSRW